ncbi:MAG: Uma2 family endonuclease [Planctomycetes bacterium]|nr:Uma2 family endonuclease [Planctomycetota bacterium]
MARPSPTLPPLENGDHLSRAEFERRQTGARPELRAELVEGVVHVVPPVRADLHGDPHARLAAWLFAYQRATPGTRVSIDATVYLGDDSAVQPDLSLRTVGDGPLRCRPRSGGVLVGPPELVAEIAASSASYDLHEKLRLYERHGVREYLVWRTCDVAVDWFALRDGRYQRLAPDRDGVLTSEVWPGLCLCVPALLAGDDRGVDAVLQEALRARG